MEFYRYNDILTEIVSVFMQNRTPAVWWIAGLLVCGLIYLLSPILTPFLVALALAYIANPIVKKITALKFKNYSPSRTVASLVVMLLMLTVLMLILLIIFPLMQSEVVKLLQKLPTYFTKTKQSIEPWLQSKFGVGIDIDFEQIQQVLTEHWSTAGNFAKNIAKTLSTQGMAIIGLVANLLLIPLVLFYLIVDWDVMLDRISALIPRKYIEKTREIAAEINAVLTEFLRGQLSVMLLMSLFYAAGLWLVGLEVAIPVGLISGLLGFVPYLGFGLGMLLGLFSGLLQFGNFTDLIPLLIVFGLGQLVESMILTPWLVGDRIGLHPLIVIFALMAGGQLFGFVGILLALPASAALAVGFKHLKASYLASDFYQKQ